MLYRHNSEDRKLKGQKRGQWWPEAVDRGGADHKGAQVNSLSGETGLYLDCGDSHTTPCVCQNSQNYVVSCPFPQVPHP